MVRKFNVHQAKSNLSRLLDDVEAGDTVVIMRHGRAVAELIPARPEVEPKRELGFARGQVKFRPGWERPMSDEEADTFLEGR